MPSIPPSQPLYSTQSEARWCGSMKKVLRIFTIVLVLAAVAYWLAAGANLGWTKTSVPLKTVDEVTGLDHIEWRKKFVPGIDFLGATLVVAVVLAGASFAFRDKSIET